MTRNQQGKFERQRGEPWTPARWEDGYVDNRGRFRVYRPDYPRAYPEGYALRAHVVYWLENGEVHPKGTVLHHKNENRLDDRISNLELMSNGEHTTHHHYQEEARIHLSCELCGGEFTIFRWRLNQRIKEGNYPRFCSQKCFHAFPRSEHHKSNISAGLKNAYKEGRR